MRISRVWRVSTGQNHYNYRGLGGAMCVFHVFGGYRPAQTTIIIGLLAGMSATLEAPQGHAKWPPQLPRISKKLNEILEIPQEDANIT